MAPKIDALLVIGAPNSSNSQRLVEVGRRAGCGYAQLVQRAADIDWRALRAPAPSASPPAPRAPEVLVEEVIDAFRARYDVTERAGRDRDARTSSSRCRASCARRSHDAGSRCRRSSSARRAAALRLRRRSDLRRRRDPADASASSPSDRSGGVLILERFGAAILGFMGGCLWGFAAGAGPRARRCLLLAGAAVPALLAGARDPAEPGALLPLARLRLRRAAGDRRRLPARRASRRAYWLTPAPAADRRRDRLPADRRALWLSSSPIPTAPARAIPGPAAGASLLVARDGERVMKERELSGGEAQTTNNRMELMAAIAALEALERPSDADHRHRQRLPARRRHPLDPRLEGNGWRTGERKPVKNEDLWRRLDAAAARHTVAWDWIKGHAGHAENERADALAREGMAPFKKKGVARPSSVDSVEL